MWVARRLGVIDLPDARKVHVTPTPRMGGIAIFAAVFASVCSAVLYCRFFDSDLLSSSAAVKISAILFASFFVFIVGLVDDVRSVSSRFKLVTLIAAAAMICGSGVVLGDFVFGGQKLIELHLLAWLLTVGWIIAVAVSINFIDGLDGLAGSLATLSATTLAVCALAAGSVSSAIIPLALVGGLLGFLIYNWHPAKTFMGDCGAMSIGVLLASAMVFANDEIGTMRGVVLPSLALGIPLIETGLTVFRRRYLQRRSMFSAERGHIHHRLLDRGLRHEHAVLFLIVVSCIAVTIGFISLAFESWQTISGLLMVVPLMWGAFRFAGSVRTNEMVTALRSKRYNDRIKRGYQSTFEQLQLEFSHVTTFSAWWDSVCCAAHQLDFIRVKLKVPCEDGRSRDMLWENDQQDLHLGEAMQASIPIKIGSGLEPTALATVDISANTSLESASERLALFSRLMTEYSLARLNLRQRQLASHRGAPNGNQDEIRPGVRTLPSPESTPFGDLRVAIIHDFYYTYCGAERVIEELIAQFPHSDLFALFDFLPEDQRKFLHGKPVRTSFIQRLPMAKTRHRAYLPLMPLAIEQLDISGYDLVISSSYMAAKGVITGPDQLHVCYCHSPVRYAWDLQHQYLDQAGLGFGIKGLFARTLLHYIRNWDVRTSLGVDHFIANSKFVGRRIKKTYRRSSTVVYPPVKLDVFTPNDEARSDDYLVLGRMVPYKRTDLIVKAFAAMPDRHLTVIGEGPDYENLRAIASPNVKFVGFQEQEYVVAKMRTAKALIFAAEEDFGIVPVEALACGTPVIAYGRGGVTETVIDGVHGVLYEEQNEASLIDAIERFEAQNDFGKFDTQVMRKQAEKFSNEAFAKSIETNITRWVNKRWPDRKTTAKTATSQTNAEHLAASDQ